jgi:hypothetical protein
MSSAVSYYDSAALLDRLTVGLKRANQKGIFLVGSALAAPVDSGTPGVPTVDGVIDLIRQEFQGTDQGSELDKSLAEEGNRYQAAFTFLLGRRG